MDGDWDRHLGFDAFLDSDSDGERLRGGLDFKPLPESRERRFCEG